MPLHPVLAESSHPFRIDPTIAGLWGPPDHLPLLTEAVRRSRRIDPLYAAIIKGEKANQLPLLYDGATRLMVHYDLKAEGIEVPYEIEKRQFECYADVVREVITIQRSRRNITEGQVAHALLEAERAGGAELTSRGRGRPKKTSAHAFPSAKKLAKQCGVSDWTLRVVGRAMAIYPALIPKIRNGEISVRTAETRLKGQTRDQTFAERAKVTTERRKICGKMERPRNPDTLAVDGIYAGDTAELMSRIEAGTISLIATSIPYPCSIEYDTKPGFDGDYPRYLEDIRKFLNEAKRVLRTGGRLAINFDLCSLSAEKHQSEDPTTLPNLYNLWADLSVMAESELGMLFFDRKHWYKQNCSAGFAAKGRGSCRAPRGNYNSEPVLVWAKGTNVLEGANEDDDIGNDEYDKFAISDWYVRPADRLPPKHPDFHPAPWPHELVYRLVKLYCYRGDIVLDPYNGSGATTFVAKALGRRYIGIDDSPLYCASAQRRAATLDGLTPAQMQARIERFVPVEGERSDGRETHRKVVLSGTNDRAA